MMAFAFLDTSYIRQVLFTYGSHRAGSLDRPKQISGVSLLLAVVVAHTVAWPGLITGLKIKLRRSQPVWRSVFVAWPSTIIEDSRLENRQDPTCSIHGISLDENNSYLSVADRASGNSPIPVAQSVFDRAAHGHVQKAWEPADQKENSSTAKGR